MEFRDIFASDDEQLHICLKTIICHIRIYSVVFLCCCSQKLVVLFKVPFPFFLPVGINSDSLRQEVDKLYSRTSYGNVSTWITTDGCWICDMWRIHRLEMLAGTVRCVYCRTCWQSSYTVYRIYKQYVYIVYRIFPGFPSDWNWAHLESFAYCFGPIPAFKFRFIRSVSGLMPLWMIELQGLIDWSI